MTLKAIWTACRKPRWLKFLQLPPDKKLGKTEATVFRTCRIKGLIFRHRRRANFFEIRPIARTEHSMHMRVIVFSRYSAAKSEGRVMDIWLHIYYCGTAQTFHMSAMEPYSPGSAVMSELVKHGKPITILQEIVIIRILLLK